MIINFIKVEDHLPKNNDHILYLVKCPNWCSTGYQVCYFTHGEFQFPEQNNDSFNGCVTEYAFIGDDFDSGWDDEDEEGEEGEDE